MILRIAKEQKALVVKELQDYFLKERDETIGNLESELFLDFLIQQIGPFIYNQAITDIQKVVMERITLLEEDLDTLKVSFNPYLAKKR